MRAPFASTLPATHRDLLERILGGLARDARVVGVAAGGSYASDSMDEHSDLDLVVAVEARSADEIQRERHAIAASLGPLIAAFTGEHVGEPRLLICLYGPPLVHVDLKFVSVHDVAYRVEQPVVLFDRDERLAAAYQTGRAQFPMPDAQWIEDRFWIWVHYAGTKIARGELFETIDFLASIRGMVLGPLALQRAGVAQPIGVRRIERVAPEFARRLTATLASHDARDCVRATRAAVELYRELRDPSVRTAPDAERRALAFLDDIARGIPA